jgi:hypothetical protein
MKTAIFLLSFFLCSINLFAQSDYKSSANLIYQPTDNGMGFRFETHNIYASYTKGTYNYTFVYIKTHTKYSLGFLIPFEYANLTAGLCYHIYSQPKIASGFNTKALKSFSFEAGCVYKYKRINIGASTDVLKWEPSILLGFNF